MKNFQIAILVTAFFVMVSAPLANAQVTTPLEPPIFEDDFSDDLHKWQPTRDMGSLWHLNDGHVDVTVDISSYITELVPKDEYWTPTAKDVAYELDYTPLQGVDRNISFDFGDVRNWCEIHFVDSLYNLVRLENGVVTLNIFNPYILKNGETYHIRIQFTQGRIQIFINDTMIVNEADVLNALTHGKIGLKVGTGYSYPTTVRFDNVTVRNLSAPLPSPTPTPVPQEKNLHVSLWKQSDPTWKFSEYDHASLWAAGDAITMQRWGCAVTSMAMILRYYGMTTLPDGQLLTPLTLNNWLKAQRDGFINGGSVNWLAVTRLTREISSILGTPKLEYAWISNALATAKNEITNNRPVIMQLPGHFLVGDGIPVDNSTILIKDPAYTYTRLDQHERDGRPLQSVRQFVPSHTDLSYLQVVHAPEARIVIKNLQHEMLPSIDAEERLSDFENPLSTSPRMIVTQLPKPAEGTYIVEMTQQIGTVATPQTITLYTYDQNGEVTIQEFSNVTFNTHPIFTIQYKKNGPSQISSNLPTKMSWAQFRLDVARLRASGDIKNASVSQYLDVLARWIEQLPPNRQRLLIDVLAAIIQVLKNHMTPSGSAVLLEDLRQLRKG